ncbi:TPA: MFS transporter [Pseudomonas aeruginosa]|uniref:MFS transporter n=1 Tax=Pseudomonas TaxID=286 RepID=UPI0008FBA9C9|nr:MFS transporter [Pseudomonas aeruginosa]MDG0898515.1 MFS transporter [Pseudomonas sp. L01]ASD14157.1 MFS transporter [Pseudomonas aeruginosa]ASP09611.1 MFS transporter [Pseudomonas aeruginosa]ASP16141.1 MFS transporter [Pseudomonas aeruginosa]KSC50917.2 MFS transporter [Pseudomonas aeruginosa]
MSALGITQIFAWGSTFYLPAVLASPIARDTGWSLSAVVGGLSWGMLVAGLCSPVAGRLLDRHGGRVVLAFSSLMLSVGLLVMSTASSLWVYYLAWSILGLGMATGLYDSAFATLGTLLGERARGAITGLTLIGGFASTAGWPAMAALESWCGWRETCWVLAAVHAVIGLPIHWLAVPKPVNAVREVPKQRQTALAEDRSTRRLFWLVAGLLTVIAFVMASLSVHLLASLQQLGIPTVTVLAIGMVIGPAQVVARVLEFSLARHLHPTWSARAGVLISLLGICLLIPGTPWLAFVAAALYGAGVGILTIARGTLPLVLFGAEGYGARMGVLARPMLLAQAAGPFAVAFVLSGQGASVMLELMAVLVAIALFASLKLPTRSLV